MITPRFPENEFERREVLRSLQILYTHPEERFDRLTRLAQSMFNVPICLISLIAGDHQWFKSSQGLDVSQTPRYLSFCGHAIHNKEAFIVPDASHDKRFFDNPLVTGAPNIRFYAGFPLTLSNDCNLGTLCLIDDSPRTFSLVEVELLKNLAQQVSLEIAGTQDSTLDDLTNISNLQGLVTLSSYVWKRYQENNQTLSMLTVKLKNLSQINSSLGRQQGDKALVELTKLMQDCFSKTDLFARTKGNEFAILYSNQPANVIEQFLHNFKAAVNKFNQSGSTEDELHIAVGRISLPAQATSGIDGLLAMSRKTMLATNVDEYALDFYDNSAQFMALECANDAF